MLMTLAGGQVKHVSSHRETKEKADPNAATHHELLAPIVRVSRWPMPGMNQAAAPISHADTRCWLSLSIALFSFNQIITLQEFTYY